LSFPSSSALKPGVAELQLEEEMHPSHDGDDDDDIPKVEMGSWILQVFFFWIVHSVFGANISLKVCSNFRY